MPARCSRSSWRPAGETGEPYIVCSSITVNRAMPKHHKRCGAEGLDLEPVLGDHAADRHRSASARTAPRSAACPRSTSRRGISGMANDHPTLHRRRDALPRQCAHRLHRQAAPRIRHGARQIFGDARTLGRAWASWAAFTVSCRRAVCRSKARWRRAGTSRCSSTSSAQGGRSFDAAGARTRALPGCADHGRDGAFQLQDGDRADRIDLDHLRRHISACIEPIPANIYTHKTLSGSFSVKNP